jgi:hypothetical protein
MFSLNRGWKKYLPTIGAVMLLLKTRIALEGNIAEKFLVFLAVKKKLCLTHSPGVPEVGDELLRVTTPLLL